MSTQRQLRRGTKAQMDAATGAEGELIYDTERKRLRNSDGVTQGGIEVPNGVDLQSNPFTAVDAAGTANVITLDFSTLGSNPTAYAEYQTFTFKPSANNTGSATANVYDRGGVLLGAKNIKKDDGSGALVDLEADDFKMNIPVQVIYDGTQFIAQLGGGGGGGGTVVLATLTASTSASLDFTSVMDNSIYSSYILQPNNLKNSDFGVSFDLRYSINNGSSWLNTLYNSTVNETRLNGVTDTTWNMVADTVKTSIKLIQNMGALVRTNGAINLYGMKSTAVSDDTNMTVGQLKNDNDKCLMSYGHHADGNIDINAIQIFFSAGTITEGSATLIGVLK